MNETKQIDEKTHGKIILALSLPLLVFLVIASYFGIFISETYGELTASYAAQGIGQDIVNLFIISPLLLISSILYYKGNRRGMFIWSGLLVYVFYSYVIYCFALPFNSLFLVYCAVLGLSFYSLTYYLLANVNKPIKELFRDNYPIKSVSRFFIIIAILFYFVWLKELIPSLISGETPQSVIENGVLTNPIHVLDLAFFLPALLITATLLLKGNKYGYLLAPILIAFIPFMALAIIGMVFVMVLSGIPTDMSLLIIFIAITILGTLILTTVLKAVEDR